ncbi:hypothetical protein C2S51_006998 [Perilla frutescens var. frutescens]|nr:hypothetical protein C2S51_006998 [Perilla frutescens var. frutescens]
MADPVIVSSGHTFDRNCLLACLSLSFQPTLPAAATATADFSTIIPNLALKSAILSWCRQHLLEPPPPIDFYSAEEIVRKLMPDNELTRPPSEVSVSITSSEERDRYSSSSDDMETSIINDNNHLLEDDDFINRLKSSTMEEQEDAVNSLRRVTRTHEEARVGLCTPRMLSALKSLISSRYSALRVNAAAALVNLSLEKQNKVKIVRSGIIPPLIDVLRGGGGAAEAQEHAAGALFSLSLDDQNKTAIGVLGALPPLLHALRSESERTRHDSALALYHLSLVGSNRVKLIKLGAVQILLGLVRSGHMAGRAMMILCNFANSVEGRAAMLDGGAVEFLVSYLSRGDSGSTSTRESCVAAIYGLSYGGLRFKGLAKEAGAEKILTEAEESVSQRAKEKLKRISDVINVEEGEDEEVDWEELFHSEDDPSRTLSQPGWRNGSNSC